MSTVHRFFSLEYSFAVFMHGLAAQVSRSYVQ